MNAKPATSASETRFEMVIVKRSLDAANAINAGNSRSRIASVRAIVIIRYAVRTGTVQNNRLRALPFR